MSARRTRRGQRNVGQYYRFDTFHCRCQVNRVQRVAPRATRTLISKSSFNQVVTQEKLGAVPWGNDAFFAASEFTILGLAAIPGV